MSAYIGKTISVITTDDVRFIGRLEGISGETSTLTLANVSKLGTEERRTGGDAVPASSEILARIEFRGSEVKDLQVLEEEVVTKPNSAKPAAAAAAAPAGNQIVSDESEL